MRSPIDAALEHLHHSCNAGDLQHGGCCSDRCSKDVVVPLHFSACRMLRRLCGGGGRRRPSRLQHSPQEWLAAVVAMALLCRISGGRAGWQNRGGRCLCKRMRWRVNWPTGHVPIARGTCFYIKNYNVIYVSAICELVRAMVELLVSGRVIGEP